MEIPKCENCEKSITRGSFSVISKEQGSKEITGYLFFCGADCIYNFEMTGGEK